MTVAFYSWKCVLVREVGLGKVSSPCGRKWYEFVTFGILLNCSATVCWGREAAKSSTGVQRGNWRIANINTECGSLAREQRGSAQVESRIKINLAGWWTSRRTPRCSRGLAQTSPQWDAVERGSPRRDRLEEELHRNLSSQSECASGALGSRRHFVSLSPGRLETWKLSYGWRVTLFPANWEKIAPSKTWF